MFSCATCHFPVLVKSLSLLIQAHPAEEFYVSFHQTIMGGERKRMSELNYELVVRADRVKREHLRECKVLILH